MTRKAKQAANYDSIIVGNKYRHEESGVVCTVEHKMFPDIVFLNENGLINNYSQKCNVGIFVKYWEPCD